METRLKKWYRNMVAEMTEAEIAAGLSNGEIEAPEWLSWGFTTIGFAIWDNEVSDGHTGLIELETDKV